MRFTALLALTLLAACGRPMSEAVVVEEAAPVVIEPEFPAGVSEPTCTPGDDDGIGGTGCQLD